MAERVAGRLIDPSNPYELVSFAGETAPNQLVALPVFDPGHPERALLLKASVRSRPIPPEARKQMAGTNGEEPPTHFDSGRLLLIIPSDVARNLRGPVEQRDAAWLFLVRRGVYERAVSGLVLPAAPTLVLPGR